MLFLGVIVVSEALCLIEKLLSISRNISEYIMQISICDRTRLVNAPNVVLSCGIIKMHIAP